MYKIVGKRLNVLGSWNEEIKTKMLQEGSTSLLLNKWSCRWDDDNIDFLRGLPSLTRISIDSDKVVDLSPLTFCKGLEYLDLECPKVKIVPDFSTFKKLEDERIDWNKLYQLLI